MQFDDAIAYFQGYIESGAKPKLKEKWEDVAESVAVHLDGKYPRKLIEERRPTETPEMLEFRKRNYEPITVGEFQNAVNGLYRIFNPDDYEIKVSADLKLYIEANNFDGTDFVSWAQHYMLVDMLRDPNGWVVVLPGGEGLMSETGRIDPKTKIIGSERICAYGYDHLIWKGYEASRYKDGGATYWMLTDAQLIFFEEKGKGLYNSEVYFEHNLMRLPAAVLGGIWTHGYYQSYFWPAVAFGNEVLKQYSDWYAQMVRAGFAVPEVLAIQCPNQPECDKGLIHKPDGSMHNCHTCNGRGYVPSLSPYGTFLRPDEQHRLPSEDRDPIRWFTPPMEPLTIGMEAWEKQYDRMRRALNLEYVQEAQSGVAKAIDREHEYASLLRISNHVWDDLIWTLLDLMERMRNPRTYQEPQVVKPTEFSMRTEADLVEDLTKLKTAKAPRDLTVEVLKELIRKRYRGNDLLIAKHDFLIQTDWLYDADEQTVAFLFNAGLVTREQVNYTQGAGSVLDALVAATPVDPIRLFDNPQQLYQTVMAEVNRLLPQAPMVPAEG